MIRQLLYIGFLLSSVPLFAQQFLEQSEAVGINHSFQHRGLIGGGVVFFDYDNDGDDDLYLTGGLKKDDLYINNGDGTFTKDGITNGLNITRFYNTIGAGAGDFDNDGDKDLMVTTWEWYNNQGAPIARNLFFENLGDGNFSEIGLSAGLSEAAFSTSMAFLDFNKDGFLDMYIVNYVDKPDFKRDSLGNVIGFASECYENYFYLNNGDMTFTEMGSDLAVNSQGCSLATIATDYDMDGDLDLYLANDYGPDILPNVLYENNEENSIFTDQSQLSGLGIGIYSMGVASSDYDHDLDLDYYVTNLGTNAFMKNDSGVFVHRSDETGTSNEWANENEYTTGWGTVFFDIDNDSWEDLFVANGRIGSIPSLPTSMVDPNKLFRNLGNGTFEDISANAGVNNTFYSRGVAVSDYDMDGDMDFFVVFLDEQGATSQFYLNTLDNDNNYIQFSLTGIESNRDAIGAKAFLYSDSLVLVKELFGGGSFCSQSSSVIHFGIGDRNTIDSVVIHWPNGHLDRINAPEINMRHFIEEFSSTTTSTQDSGTEFSSDISIFPNPTSDYLNIIINSVATYDVHIYNTQGHKIATWIKLFSSTKIDISSIPSGLYFITINGNSIEYSKAIIVL